VYSIRNPNRYITSVNVSPQYFDWLYAARDNSLWGHNGNKSIYDPCPAGWRVPVNYGLSAETCPWYGFASDNGTWSLTNDQGFQGGWSWGTNAVYPITGYRSRETGTVGVPAFGECWIASPNNSSDENRALRMFFMISQNDDGMLRVFATESRAYGFPTRCVRE
jgi:hypothetical protein